MALKLAPELEEQAVVAAETIGISTHAFIIGAIRQALDSVEQRAEFVSQAQIALTEMLESGRGYDGDDVAVYLEQRHGNRYATRPLPKPWRI
ncbi:hypothetical protein [Massilia antarctica]|uniref:hypothetical protein n=1 Tax=Massilia antarctica TaxID=2765360 RepID=UPI0006BB7CEA|nr:hypothetical protein [Massilia sp. H27-R4]MCY0914895.1 hypothetical protein [Massilia sp. H27-R4]